METPKSAWHFTGKIFAIIGAASFALSIILALSKSPFDSLSSLIAAILAKNFSETGAVFFVLGMCFYLYGKSTYVKRERLKMNGVAYDAEVVRILPNPIIRIYSYVSAVVECGYRNHEGKTCLVKSGTLLLSRVFFPYLTVKENGPLYAKVYVNRNNPADYAVEVYIETAPSVKFDLDYR